MHWSAHAHYCRLLATAGLVELECCKQFCAAAGKTHRKPWDDLEPPLFSPVAQVRVCMNPLFLLPDYPAFPPAAARSFLGTVRTDVLCVRIRRAEDKHHTALLRGCTQQSAAISGQSGVDDSTSCSSTDLKGSLPGQHQRRLGYKGSQLRHGP